jgi:hypothetical protein
MKNLDQHDPVMMGGSRADLVMVTPDAEERTQRTHGTSIQWSSISAGR